MSQMNHWLCPTLPHPTLPHSTLFSCSVETKIGLVKQDQMEGALLTPQQINHKSLHITLSR